MDANEMYLEEYYKYKCFINSCKLKEYEGIKTHKHHIIPKHFDGNNNYNNLVKLSIEDHIQAHLLLALCFPAGSKERLSNLRSAKLLSKNNLSNELKEEIRENSKGSNNPFKNKKHTDATKKIISNKTKEQLTGVSYSDRYGIRAEEEKKKRSDTLKMYWNGLSEEEKNKRCEKFSKIENKKKYTGGSNNFSKPIVVNNIKFDSIIDACKYFGMNRYYLEKNYKIERL